MQQVAIHHSTPLRFSRWSRAGYAAFRTLKKEVSIGRVHAEISDSLMKETSGLVASPTRLSPPKNEKEELAVLADPLFLDWLFLPFALFMSVIEDVVSSDYSLLNKNNLIADKKGLSLFYPHFF